MKKTEYYVIAFANTHSAMVADKRLNKKYSIMMIPTLREISAGCGISIKIAPEDIEGVKTEMKNVLFKQSVYKVYAVTTDNGSCCVEEEMEKNEHIL